MCFTGFRRNEDMKAMEVLPILKEKVAYLSGKKGKVIPTHTHTHTHTHN